MRHYALFEGDAQPIRPVLHVFDHHAVASLHIGHGTLFAIGFPDNGGIHVAAHVKYFVSLLPVFIPMSPNSDHFAVQMVTSSSPLPVLVPYGQKAVVFAALVIYLRQFLPALVPMSLEPVPLAILVAYFSFLLPIRPVTNLFSSKRNFMVWKVVKLVTVLTPFLERIRRYLYRTFAQKRKRGNKEDCCYFFQSE